MKAMETTVDKFGRIVLPQQVRDDLGLAPGSVLKVEERGEGIVLKPVAEHTPLALRDGILVFTGEVEGDIDDVLRRDRAERSRKLANPE